MRELIKRTRKHHLRHAIQREGGIIPKCPCHNDMMHRGHLYPIALLVKFAVFKGLQDKHAILAYVQKVYSSMPNNGVVWQCQHVNMAHAKIEREFCRKITEKLTIKGGR